jgi:putrescine aminotransferase
LALAIDPQDWERTDDMKKQDQPKLLSLADCQALPLSEVKNYYTRHVNPGLVKIMAPFGFGDDLVTHASGQYMYTESGRKIVDLTGGFGVLSHGHNHPRILKARMDYQRDCHMEVHKSHYSRYLAGLSYNVSQLLPKDLDISFFCNSGAEAVDGALKLAYKYHDGRRRHVLHSDRSFHGKLLGAGSVSESESFQTDEMKFSFPEIPDTKKYEFNSIQSIKEQLATLKGSDGKPDVYAILVEPFSASTLTPCSGEFLEEIREICSRDDIVLIFDEVYTGWGKCGELFYFMKHDTYPDILTVSKSFGGGKSSISGYITRTPVFMKAYGDVADAILHSTTYNGFGEECVTAIEAVNVIVEEDYPEKARRIGQWLAEGLAKIKQAHPKAVEDIRGTGAIMGIVLRSETHGLDAMVKMLPGRLFKDPLFLPKLTTMALIDDLYRNHDLLTYVTASRQAILNIAPPLIVEKEDIDKFMAALDHTLSQGLARLTMRLIKNRFMPG